MKKDKTPNEITSNVISEIGKEVYKDAISPSMKTIGKTAEGLVKFLLSPIRGLIWCWDKIENAVESGITKRLEGKTEEELTSPDPRIAVPAIQALTYSAQENEIREMFLNLLANDMQKDKKSLVHPTYVEIIKSMSPLDAHLLKILSLKMNGYIKLVNPKVSPKKNSGQIYSNATPDWFLGFTISDYSIFDISSSLLHLQKFGLIDLMYDRTAGTEEYAQIEDSPLLQPILAHYKNSNPEAILTFTHSVLNVNDYGKSFIKICM